MRLYLIYQDANVGYDTYDSAVVCAKSATDARNTSPYRYKDIDPTYVWTTPDNVKVRYLGEAKRGMKAGIICASFNAG